MRKFLQNANTLPRSTRTWFAAWVQRECSKKKKKLFWLIYSLRRAPFTYDAWKSPEVLARISEVAGIDLVPSIDFEIANINISIRDENTNVEETIPIVKDDDLPAVAWHYDSFPFVCVTMLSDCTGMIGGETALRTPSGDIMKVRGPAMVSNTPSDP